MNKAGERLSKKLREAQGIPDGSKSCQNLRPREALTKPCANCYGTGTIFKGKTLKVGNSVRCPVCKGTCKVPFEGTPL